MWLRMWAFNADLWMNVFPHWRQAQRLSPVWIIVWPLNEDSHEKLSLQNSHLKGLSFVWATWWVSRWCFLLNFLLHLSHLYGLIPLWIISCWCKPWDDVRFFPQVSQGKYLVFPILCVKCNFNSALITLDLVLFGALTNSYWCSLWSIWSRCKYRQESESFLKNGKQTWSGPSEQYAVLQCHLTDRIILHNWYSQWLITSIS